MGQYKRMVSYLYKYINGAKSQNTGFVRIELMDVQCRFTVQMRMVPFEVFPKVYLYIQKEHGAKCIEVSDMGTKSGNLVSRFALDKNNIEQTGYSFDDIDGLVVYISDEMFFATSWVRDEVKLGQIEIVSKTREMPADSIFETENTKRLNENNISEVKKYMQLKYIGIPYEFLPDENKTTNRLTKRAIEIARIIESTDSMEKLNKIRRNLDARKYFVEIPSLEEIVEIGKKEKTGDLFNVKEHQAREKDSEEYQGKKIQVINLKGEDYKGFIHVCINIKADNNTKDKKAAFLNNPNLNLCTSSIEDDHMYL